MFCRKIAQVLPFKALDEGLQKQTEKSMLEHSGALAWWHGGGEQAAWPVQDCIGWMQIESQAVETAGMLEKFEGSVAALREIERQYGLLQVLPCPIIACVTQLADTAVLGNSDLQALPLHPCILLYTFYNSENEQIRNSYSD